MIPTRSEPISSSADGIVWTNEKTSACEGWTGSSATGTPAAWPASATARMPSRTTSCASPGPVRKTTQTGSSAASRRTLAHSASTRCAGSSGPSIGGSGRIEGTEGMQCVARKPLSRNRRAESSPSFSSQTPMPPTPAARYAARSSAKLAVSVVNSQIDRRTPARLNRRR